MTNPIPIYTVHNAFDLFAEPAHFPFTVGNEQFIITQQDQRSILDRRTWYLARSSPSVGPLDPVHQTHYQSNQIPLQQLIHHLISFLALQQCPQLQSNPPVEAFQWHYEKQTSTDDLPYYLRRNGIEQARDAAVVRHVHFLIDHKSRDKAINTEGWPTTGGERMDCDPDKGTGASPGSTGAGNAYDLIKQKKENERWFW